MHKWTNSWRKLPLFDRVRWLRYFLPPAFALIVILYQLVIARPLEEAYGHLVHYTFEIAFYSLTGPVITWVTLKWVERNLKDKDKLERKVRARTQQLASLTDASADAILSLDHAGTITSWNQGAKRLIGYAEHEAQGMPVESILPEFATMKDRLAKLTEVKDFETVAQTRVGKRVFVELTQTKLTEGESLSPVSLIIMRDITLRREREAIIEEERARIARDLHDGVAQSLYFIALKADLVQQRISPENSELVGEMKDLSREARRVIREVRSTIYALRPLDWTEGGFLPALREFVEGYAEQLGWKFKFNVDEKLDKIPPRLEPTIFRLVQESLNNVAKHADAEHVDVQLHQADETAQLLLKIVDDGGGFDSKMEHSRGLGLGQMRSRVEAVGGLFQVESQSGIGTTTIAHFPMLGVPA